MPFFDWWRALLRANPTSTSNAPASTSSLAQDLLAARAHAKRTGFVYPDASLCLPSFITVNSSLSGDQKAELVDRIRGVVHGNCIGDAVGLPTEFHSKANCAAVWPTGCIELNRAVRSWAAGDWTDDSDQMLLILDTLVSHGGKVDVRDFARRLRVWLNNGFTELGDCGGYGCGQTVGSVVDSEDFENDPHTAAREVCERMNGKAAANGALMRTSILGAAAFESLDVVVDNTVAIATTTHADLRCVASCIVCTVTIALTLQDCLRPHADRQSGAAILDRAIQTAIDRCFTDPQHEWALELRRYCSAQSLAELQLDEGRGIGYTYRCIGAGVWAYRQYVHEDGADFRSVLTAVAMEGGDADTNGAVAGAMLGARLGYARLDKQWRDALLHRQWLDKRVNNLLVLMGLDTVSQSRQPVQ